MTINNLQQQARAIWGSEQMDLDTIITALGVVYGDICRQNRAFHEGKELDDIALQKELGNIIFSTIRWCQHLGYQPEACLQQAIKAQKQYVTKLK